ncbi:MAG TPA: asparagine synthase (glutamine-hydrolyzing) [Anaerolineae bacterium]|nr:asparagine synthase (glutamine-hydrolyzing) [Anaerolineae bacterium]
MCGIAGVLNLVHKPPAELATLGRMLGAIRHRGPDEFGIYRDAHACLGNARLSILDLSGGQQPIGNQDGSLWIVYNGEVFDYVELRLELEARGHRFTTRTDTEVVLHLYEEHGPACLERLNGQFAMAIWDVRERCLFLARDRLGVRPLFYTIVGGQLLFASEIKALLAHPNVKAELDPDSLDQVFTFWSTLSPRTAFRNIVEVPPGHYLQAREGQVTVQSYWAPDLTPDPDGSRTGQDYLEELESLLIDATRIRLRADVPVGAYLSGGLDSSITAAIIRKYNGNRLDTFSIAFEDPQFDESQFQRRMAAALGTDHRVAYCTSPDIGAVFPEVIWHTETPVLRTAPAPMFLLSRLVRDHALKVVLTGEGADEFLAGYDIFKEMKIRRFWARDPESQIRPLLLKRLYPDISGLASSSGAYLAAFFRQGLADTDSPFYSHAIRWANTARIRCFLLRGSEASHSGRNGYPEPPAPPPAFQHWSHLGQAQYLEISIFLSQYLLSSQGDRMGMAHSVEGRFPFLDHRLVEFCNRLPAGLKLRGLTEKWLLRQLGRKLLPPDIWQRPKRPYRAPIHRSFFGPAAPEYVPELLSEPALRESALFDPGAVARLERKARQGSRLNEVDSMALVGILSTQWVYHHFVKGFRPPLLRPDDLIKVVDATPSTAADSGVARGERWAAYVTDNASLASDPARVRVGEGQ